MGRRGELVHAETAGIIFAVVVMVGIIALWATLADAGEQEFSKRETQLSLQLTKAAAGATGLWCIDWTDNPVAIRYTRRFLTVGEDDVRKGGSQDGNLESVKYGYNAKCPGEAQLDVPDFGTEEGLGQQAWGGACLAQNVLAKEMAACWDIFFQGTVPVFQQVDQDRFTFFQNKKEATACVVCAEVVLRTGEDISGFTDYLREKQYALDVSYYDFLARNRQAMCAERVRDRSVDAERTCWNGMAQERGERPEIDQDAFIDGKKYAIVFIREGMDKCPERGNSDEAPTMTVQAIPAEDIGRHCDVVLA